MTAAPFTLAELDGLSRAVSEAAAWADTDRDEARLELLGIRVGRAIRETRTAPCRCEHMAGSHRHRVPGGSTACVLCACRMFVAEEAHA